MEKLLEMAGKVADEAEVFHDESDSGSITIRDEDLRDIDGSIQTGYALRMIKDGRMGMAYTKNLLDREELIKNALASLKGNMDAKYGFQEPSKVKRIDQYDKRVESLTYSDLYEKCKELTSFFSGKVKGQVDVGAAFTRNKRRVVNTHGVDLTQRSTSVIVVPQLLYPNTETSIYLFNIYKNLRSPDKKALQGMLDLYGSSLPEVRIESGRSRVMFLDKALWILMWRFSVGTNGRNVFTNTSPLIDKIGDTVLSEEVTIYNDPHTELHGALAFDDEGTPTKRLEFFSKGVLKSYHVNLDYAQKLEMEPTGTGFRGTIMFGGDPVSMPPDSLVRNPRIAIGDRSYDELVGSIKNGVIVSDGLGAHSGNIMNGDFSIGLSPGFAVKDGEIVGRVKDGMVAGNVYDMFRNVAGIENRIHNPDGNQKYPCILFDDVNVAAK